MKKLCTILLYVFALLNTAVAQKLSVESFVLAPTDITAQTEGRKDLNGDACALVKIFVVGDVADVEGNVVKSLVKKNSQTWAFMTQGSKQMQVIAQNALPLMVTFADYGIGKLEGNRTYILTLNQVGGASASTPSTSNGESTKSSLNSISTSQVQTPSASVSLPSGRVITIPVKNGVSIEMVRVKSGSFDMGDVFNKPIHRVTLTNDYYLGKYEVTQALWKTVMGNNPSFFKEDNNPVEQVSWDDCQIFIEKLNALTGFHFRLPTEAEWEYAESGGRKSRGYRYSGSNTLGDVAWHNGNSGSKTHTVGTKQPNELGIYDMTGNVAEWCQDVYGPYASGPQNNPMGAKAGKNRVVRDGDYSHDFKILREPRLDLSPEARSRMLGFRLALSK